MCYDKIKDFFESENLNKFMQEINVQIYNIKDRSMKAKISSIAKCKKAYIIKMFQVFRINLLEMQLFSSFDPKFKYGQ